VSDSNDMARVATAVERIDVAVGHIQQAVDRLVECVLAPRIGLLARIEVLEERMPAEQNDTNARLSVVRGVQ
jgi:hypothetical protein